MTPHVSEYGKGNLEENSLTEAERSDERRAISQRKRKLIERGFAGAIWSSKQNEARIGGFFRSLSSP